MAQVEKKFYKCGPGKTVEYKTFRLTMYDGGWQVFIGIGGPDLEKHAQARARMSGDAAIRAGKQLIEWGEQANLNREGDEGEWVDDTEDEEEVEEKPRSRKKSVNGRKKNKEAHFLD